MISFVQMLSQIMFFFNFVLWLVYKKKQKSLSRKSRFVVNRFLIFLLIYIIWNFSSMLINICSAKLGIITWIIFWIIISIYEFYLIFATLFIFFKSSEKYIHYLPNITTIAIIPSIIAGVLTWIQKSYNPINSADFYNIILFLFGSLSIIRYVLMARNFRNYLEIFFIFSGFLLYFGLHIIASNILSIDFLENWDFSQFATLVSLIFWLGSVFFIWKIKSKLS